MLILDDSQVMRNTPAKFFNENGFDVVGMASSISDARTVMKCLKIGAKQYILKPYDEQRVMAAISKALNI